LRPVVLDFARDVAESFPLASPLVEMGARAAEGQEGIANLRPLFKVDEYIGCDIQEGLGVDRIEDIHHLTFADESVGTVIALETLEHVADPIRAVQEMFRVLRPGGVLAISSLMFFPIHEHPWDYWRFTPVAFEMLLEPFEASWVVAQGYHLLPEGIFGVGVKGPFPGEAADLLPRTVGHAERWGQGTIVDYGPIRLSMRQMWRDTLRYSVIAGRRKLQRLTARSSQTS
jgi:SAM-dependent methyltransferase